MALNFPGSPSNGQTYVAPNGVTYVYDASETLWRVQSGDGENVVFVSATAPVAPTQGKMWWNSNTGVMYVYYIDANSAQWVPASSTNVGAITPGMDAEFGDVTAEDVQVTSLNSGPLAGFRNQLINGGLEVSQRNAGGVAGSVYTIDRWHASAGTRTGFSTRLLGPFSKVMLCASGSAILLIQPIETPATGHRGAFQPATQWTCSFWTNATGADLAGIGVGLFHGEGITNTNVQDITGQNLAGVTVIPGEDLTDNTSTVYQRVSVTFTLNSNVAATGNAVQFRVNYSSLSTDVRSIGFQVEPGPVATPFEHRPIGTELTLCQRYYWQLNYASNNDYLYFFQKTPSQRDAVFMHPVEMRVKPTTTASINSGVIVANDGSNRTWAVTINSSSSDVGGYFINSFTADAEL